MNTKNTITGYVVDVANFRGHAQAVIVNGNDIYSERSIEDYEKEGFKILQAAEFDALHTEWLQTKVKSKFVEIEPEKWEDALESLPPLKWHTLPGGRWNIFFHCEMYTASYSSMYVKDRQTGKCYVATKNSLAPDAQHLEEITAEILNA